MLEEEGLEVLVGEEACSKELFVGAREETDGFGEHVGEDVGELRGEYGRGCSTAGAFGWGEGGEDPDDRGEELG